jgi:hypothetical protein
VVEEVEEIDEFEIVQVVVRFDGKPLDPSDSGQSTWKAVESAIVENVQKKVDEITCPVHAKRAERVTVDVDTKNETALATPDGFCCDQLKDLVKANFKL